MQNFDCSDLPFVFLGTEKGLRAKAYFAVGVSGLEAKDFLEGGPEKAKFIDLRTIAMGLEGDSGGMTSLLARGKMILDWHERHGYCATCGTKTLMIKGGYMRKCQNVNCKVLHFPRTDPVVIMMVTYGNECLLGRSPHFRKNNYSALAGFMEPGETIEEAMAREVHEEVNLTVNNIRYVKSQPWPFPSTLMIGCIGEAADKDVRIDGTEIEDVIWVKKSELLKKLENERVTGEKCTTSFNMPPKLAIARHLLELWAYDEI
jgi:NAD+ diphosphatase